MNRSKGEALQNHVQARTGLATDQTAAFGVTQLTDAGMPTSSDSRDLCREEGKRRLESANGASTDAS